MVHSDEQLAIINAIFEKIMLIIAYAGSGKSSTLKEFCLKRPENTFFYFVFSHDMMKEAKEKFEGLKVTISTFHALAFASHGKFYIDRLNDELRAFHLQKYIPKNISEENIYLYAAGLLKLLNQFAASDKEIVQFVISKRREKSSWSIANGVPLDYLLKILPSVWEDVILDNSIPFSHDFYLKLYQLSNPSLDFDYILVDEGQDITPCMLSIAISQKGKIIIVGDEFQQIFAWRGAVNSLRFVRENYDASVYYLSQSFRCSEKIGLIADRVISKNGASKSFKGVGRHPASNNKTMYIGRTSSGVFDFCADNIGKKIFFVGGSKKYNFGDIKDLKYLQIGRKEFIQNSFIANFGSFKDYVNFANKTNDPSMKVLAGIIFKYGNDNIFNLIKEIKASEVKKFGDSDFGIVSGHKSKGLEWENCELLDDFPLGKTKMKKMSKEQLFEENNLLYVAITRAKCKITLPTHIEDYISAPVS